MNLHEPEVSAALDTLNRLYHDEVRGWVEDFETRAKGREWGDRDSMLESIEQELDWAACVIYTYQARLVGVLSNSYNDACQECEDMGLENPTPEQIAFLCLKLDVLGRLDFDTLFSEDEDA